MSAVVIGLGNEFRRDDGVGPVVADTVRRLAPAEVTVRVAAGDPTDLLEAWASAELAVIVDAAGGAGAVAGRVRRWTPADAPPAAVSSHALDLAAVYALARALGRAPQRLVVFTVDAADLGHGHGMTPAVAAAVPRVVSAIVAETETTHDGDASP